MVPANREGESRDHAVFMRSVIHAVFLFVPVMLIATSGTASFRVGVTSQFPEGAYDLVNAAGGSVSVIPRSFVPTLDMGLDAPVSSNVSAGVFVSRTQFDTGVGTFHFNVLGGSLMRQLVLGALFGWRLGFGFADGSGATRSSVGVTEFVISFPIPGLHGAGVAVVHQILVDHSPSSAGFSVFQVQRIGMTAQIL